MRDNFDKLIGGEFMRYLKKAEYELPREIFESIYKEFSKYQHIYQENFKRDGDTMYLGMNGVHNTFTIKKDERS